jgi:hypothetical protein
MSDKKKAPKKTAKVVDIKELTERLGPVKKVVKTSKAESTDTAVVLHLECGHKRVGTKRASLRCRRCRKGAKPAAAVVKKSPVKSEKKPVAKKTTTVVTVQKSGKPKVTREPVTAPSVEKTVETVAAAMDHKRKKK